jgi:DNA polymerase III sliding clamp (beta) subunit (PCNA family)
LKFKIKIGEFVEQISQAAITTDPKSADQPNSKVYLRAAQGKDVGVLYYYSTNQMTKTFIRSEAEIIEPGEVLVDATSLLGGLMGRDPELTCEVTVEPEVSTLVVIGRNKFHLKYYPAAERMSKEVDTLPFRVPAMATIPGQLLGDLIRRTTFCIPSASNGQQRFAMDVLHLKGVGGKWLGQATDGNIISLNYGPAPAEAKADVPSLLIAQEALNPLQKLLAKHKEEDIDLVNSGESDPIQQLFFRMKGVLFGCNLRTGKFPNIGLVVEQQSPEFATTVIRNELKSALSRASNFVKEDSRCVKLTVNVTGISMKVAAANDFSDIVDEVDSEVVSGTCAAMQTTIGIDYIANIVGVLTGEKTTLGMSTTKGRAVILSGETTTEDGKLLVGSVYAISPVTPPKPPAPAAK